MAPPAAIAPAQDPTRDRGAPFARVLAEWRAGQPGGLPVLMGIVNVTPDSFSDGGLYADTSTALGQARQLLREGAAIVDVGGESTRPDAQPVSPDEERRRTLPIVEALVGDGAIVSIDTVKPQIADDALRAGAAILNDIRGLQGNPELAEVAGAHRAGVVIMHNPGLLGSSSGTEGDPVHAVQRFFDRSLAIAARAGVPADRIALDPGFGFGKTLEQQLELLARFEELTAMGFPILAGTSRKSFIGRVTGVHPAGRRLLGTVATNVVAALAGAAVLRVHDVAANMEAVRIAAAVRGARMGPPRA